LIFGVKSDRFRDARTQKFLNLLYYTVQVNELTIFRMGRGRMKTIKADMPVLIGQAGPLNGRRWEIAQDLLIVRDETFGVVIQDRQVSRFHARISVTAQGVMVEDLASKNGTFRNGALLEEPVVLEDGDMVQIAMIQHFLYLSSDSTEPLGPGMPIPEFLPASNEAGDRLRMDPLSRRVWIESKEMIPPLSVPQFQLLEALYNSHGTAVSRQDLITTVWGDDEAAGVSEQAMDALVRRLRDRIAALDRTHDYILTVRGFGFRLDNPPAR
jgi:hypothetical protein